MSKYKSVKTVIDGIKFDSKAEGEFYLYLRRKEDKGEIKLIGVHPKVILQEKFFFDDKKLSGVDPGFQLLTCLHRYTDTASVLIPGFDLCVQHKCVSTAGLS